MFRNYLITALRNLVRNRLYAAINIVGLAVAFAAALLLALFLRDEASYEKWMPGHERTYAVRYTVSFAVAAVPSQIWDRTADSFAGWLKSEVPGVENAVRLACVNFACDLVGIRHGDVEADEQLYWADPDFFSVIPLPAIAGDVTSALLEPDGIVITRKMARKYFGHDNPLGETLEIDRQHSMRVTAVLEDLPSNTHLQADFIASARAPFSALAKFDANPSMMDDYSLSQTYFRLAPGVDIEEVKSTISAVFDRHGYSAWVAEMKSRGQFFAYSIQPISSIHMSPGNRFIMKPRGSATTNYAFAAIGSLLIVIAGINFVNLMTARAMRRAVEIGVRKVSGAMHLQLAIQFIGEALIYVAIALVFASMMVLALTPEFNAFFQRTSIAFDFWRDPVLAAYTIGGAALIGLLAGLYPAIVLPLFRPAAVLRGGMTQTFGSGRLRQCLVILQFAVLIGLSLMTMAIFRQTSFAFNEGMRLPTDQVLLVKAGCQPAFKDEVSRLPGVRGAACSGANALGYDVGYGDGTAPNGKTVALARHSVGIGFLELYGFQPLAGRFFDNAHASDMAKVPVSYVLNETAVRQFGFKSAEEAIGQEIKWPTTPGYTGPGQIIGVVADFAVDAVHKAIYPTMYFTIPQPSYLNVRLTGSDVPETLAAIDRLWSEFGEPKAITRFFLDQRVQELYLDITRQLQLFAAFSVITILIACLGLFGLAAFTAETRTKEIGVRKAMGARTGDILRLMIWQFTKPVLWANVIAWPAGYFVMRRWLEGFAYHIELSLWMFLGASALALGIAILTVAGHALLVARAQPVAALR